MIVLKLKYQRKIMSGGAFEYKQYKIQDLIEDMENLLVRLDKEPIDSFECDSLKRYVNDSELFKNKIKENIRYLKRAYIFTQRIDWFISGDDCEENFYERLKEEIEKLEYEEITETNNLLVNLANPLKEDRSNKEKLKN